MIRITLPSLTLPLPLMMIFAPVSFSMFFKVLPLGPVKQVNCNYHRNNTSETDVAPWCYKWVDGMDWIYPGGVKYRAPYGANNISRPKKLSLSIPYGLIQ